ncbi:hypothetical protein [Hyphomonas pacifica]|uniref:Uncharacterized protein n=1 Tax=Hyphomonas pacifica TaxID=1280941 RepID=A0A062U7W0_9PROT|nr:hypothetical protein [Hyphomonas pacifica]KCZ52225.1 hypothetical protein HY2_09415 [Hyphomonas pacifica]RAN35079.1 hypothetical protein HY3_09545 [Hyphomonas pacifica]RAN37540.1 hypothetical protein HY11_08620 [Hyphomonas pacifica]
MPFLAQLLTALTLLVAGLIKAVSHMTVISTLSIPTCLGNSQTIALNVSFWERAHCWGCYAALTGAVWLTILSVLALPRYRARLIRAK